MAVDQWDRVREILGAALERPPDERSDFLEQACGVDRDLRNAVESFIAYEDEGRRFLEKPPVRGMEKGASLLGRTLSHYEILDVIGRGGMGEVYLAEDTELGREVALKVLPPELAESEERRTRFKREAKALAALNHPNIVTIYSVEQSDGVHFITMELVKGKTLAELLPKGGLPLDRFLEIAIFLADAVSAAHEQGIIHRDLKPENLMVSDEGRPKVLDFGLAKPERGLVGDGAGSEVPIEATTDEGTVLGTVSYMSPEQAQGKAVDHRSDIFSLGVVFYEMLAGERPFGADSSAAILSSILQETPAPLREHRPEVPRELEKIVGRCPAKEPRRRIQDVLDLHNALVELKQDLASGELDEGLARAEPARTNKWLVAVALGSLLSLAGVLAYVLWPSSGDSMPLLASPVQITSAVGVEDFPTWSPDGSRLAFQSDQSGNHDIWVVQLGGGAPVNRTADRPGSDRRPSWSPDGSQIAFGSGRAAFVMSAVGGAARKVLAPDQGVPTELRWSVDGDSLAVSCSSACFVDLVSLPTEESRRYELPRGCWDMSWSPDGRYFTCISGNRYWEVNEIYLHPLSGAEPISITGDLSRNWSPTWSADGRRLYFVSNRGGSMDLWQQRIHENGTPQGEPEPVTTGVGIRTAAFSPDGTKLAYSRGGPVANVWRVPIRKERPATWDDAEQITFDRANIRYLDLSPDGRTLLVSSDRAGHQSLWKLPSEGGEMTRITVGPAPDLAPDWSSDGTEIVFTSWRSGNRDLFVVPSEGGPARPLTTYPGNDNNPTWSPDGSKIVFYSTRNGSAEIWVVSAEGGEPWQVTDDPTANAQIPLWSPDGRWLVFLSETARAGRMWRVPAEGGTAEPLTQRSGHGACWSPDGSQLYYTGNAGLWALSMDDGTEYPLMDLTGRPGELGRLTLDTDGEFLYFTWKEDLGDIWVMDVVTDS